MRKRILSILLSVCMALTLLPTVALASPVSYGIWVGATEVTSENMDGVIGDGICGTVTYDASSNTLTLNNATITKTNNYNFAISSEINGSRDLKINLVGSNAITIGSPESSVYGVNAICSYAKVSIKGSEGSSLFVSTPLETTKYKVCIYGKEGVTIEGCAVTATTGNTTGNEKEPCIGINIDSGPLSIKNATVTATAGNTTGYSFGINVSGASSPITIEGSTVTAIGGDGGLGSYGIRYGGSLSIEDSTVIAKTMDTTGIVQALYTALTPAMLGTGVTAQGSTSSDGTGAVTYVPANNATYKWVQIAPASLSQPVISTLAISGSFTAGHNYTVSDLDSYKPAITPNGVTITAEGWQQCVEFGTYSSGWSNWSAGVLSPDTGSTYKLRYYATYSDGTVYSNEVTLNVVGNTTSLALMATPESPQNTGTPITLTATLTGFFPGPGVSGQAIIFKNGGSSCGNAALNAAGVAVFSWTPPGTGTYSLTAEYYGSLYNTAATSAAVSATGSLDLTGVSCNVAAGTITGTTDNMEYSLDDGGTWQDCTAGDTTGLTFATGTVKVRQKDKTANEHTVITIVAPVTSNTPTLGSKTYNSVTLTAMTGYEYSKDGGATWQNSNLFASLSSSTTYSFVARIKATATALPGTISAVLNVTTNEAPSGDGGSNGGGTNTPVGTPVIVDGKTQNIGTEKKSGDSTTVTVDQSKLGTNIGGATAGSSVVVPVSENGVATASLVVKNIEDMAAKGMTLTIQTGSVAYNLNTAAIDTAALQAAFPGADMSAVPFNVTITNSSASVEGETLVLSPMSFTVTAAYGGKTVDVDAFSAYIDRVIEVTKEQAAKITTAVVVNADGSVRHVPTNVIEKDGKYYAIINSRTNSTYALIQNEVTFSDATGKWYEAAVNEMGSRKIIAGRSADLFDGGASITRAEFAAILIRALGLPADGASTFSDVPANAWYTGAAATAVKYGLAEGKGDNRFDPSAAITRQEAMLMLQRAAALTEFTGTSGDLGSFADANSVGSWAQGAAKWSVGSSLIQGSGGKLNPTANITRAESATIILRLLQKAELVDVRSKA